MRSVRAVHVLALVLPLVGCTSKLQPKLEASSPAAGPAVDAGSSEDPVVDPVVPPPPKEPDPGPTTPTAKPPLAPGAPVCLSDQDLTKGTVGGPVTITPPASGPKATSFALHWAKADGSLVSGGPFLTVAAASLAQATVPSGTAMPDAGAAGRVVLRC